MRDVLKLNFTYEPLDVINAEDALRLLFKGKAEIVVPDTGAVHSANTEMQLPSVIRIFRYVKFKRKPIRYSRKNVLIRDNFTCQYCGVKLGRDSKKLTIDHIWPQKLGGQSTWENTVASCIRCNSRKGHKTLKEIGYVLLREPGHPPSFKFARNFDNRPEWQPFLFV